MKKLPLNKLCRLIQQHWTEAQKKHFSTPMSKEESEKVATTLEEIAERAKQHMIDQLDEEFTQKAEQAVDEQKERT